eukprot:TRINITY_DN4311_c0_g1_i1.p1 TRINITY_DN4311_c0_g1~~TRINITY_DN4311_c0_g1_i1.p1  ORF type:complete len:525 (-),score=90.47 TRINITY_DN4311_c0_g1_i1:179-1753(-)
MRTSLNSTCKNMLTRQQTTCREIQKGSIYVKSLSRRYYVRASVTSSQNPSDSPSSSTHSMQGLGWKGRENPKVCILGGGFGGLYTATKLENMMWPKNKKPIVTLVDQQERFVFKPMLYELLVNTVQPWEVAPTFQQLLAPYPVQIVKGKVSEVVVDEVSVQNSGGKVFLSDGQSLDYDWLVISLGAEPNLQLVPGAKQNALPFCTYNDAAQVKEKIETLKKSSKVATIAIVGANYSGIELAGVISEVLGKDKCNIIVYTPTAQIMQGAPEAQIETAQNYVQDLGIQVKYNTFVTQVQEIADNPDKKILHSSGDEKIEVDLVLWTAGNTPVTQDVSTKYNAFPFPKTDKGLLKVDSTLRVEDNPRVFALGDTSGFQPDQNALQPATAQVAMQQADYAAWNVWSSINGRTLLQFKYQHLGNMMSLGRLQGSVAVNLPVPYPISTALNSSSILNNLLSAAGIKVEGGKGISIEGPTGGLIRRAAYLYRQPTDEHRVRVGVSWFQQGLKDASDIANQFASRFQSSAKQ